MFRMFSHSATHVTCLTLLCLTWSSLGLIETWRSPTDTEVIEVERNTSKQISVGIWNIPSDDASLYRLRLRYKLSTLAPDVKNNLGHLLNLHADDCISSEEGTRCMEVEIIVHGHQELNNQSISLVVYKIDPTFPIPTEVRGLEPQQFTIRIIDSPPLPRTSPTALPTSSLPSAAMPSITCPPAVIEPEAQIKLSSTGGSAVLGVLLAAAFFAAFLGNFVFMLLWYKARTRKCKECKLNKSLSLSPVHNDRI